MTKLRLRQKNNALHDRRLSLKKEILILAHRRQDHKTYDFSNQVKIRQRKLVHSPAVLVFQNGVEGKRGSRTYLHVKGIDY